MQKKNIITCCEPVLPLTQLNIFLCFIYKHTYYNYNILPYNKRKEKYQILPRVNHNIQIYIYIFPHEMFCKEEFRAT